MRIRFVPVVPGTLPRRNAEWDIVLSGQIGRSVMTDETDDVSVGYVLTDRDGSAIGSGSLSYDEDAHPNQWSDRISLPATAGPMTCVVTVSATDDDATVTATTQASIEVL